MRRFEVFKTDIFQSQYMRDIYIVMADDYFVNEMGQHLFFQGEDIITATFSHVYSVIEMFETSGVKN